VTLIAALHEGGLGERVAECAGCAVLALDRRRFPDDELYLRVCAPVDGERVWIVANLARPDTQLLAVLLLARTLRAQGAAFVGLVAPYLPYLRQDTAFRPGECVSAPHFCALLDAQFDALITVDAHLHRIARLDALFTIPARNLGAAVLLARQVARELDAPLLVGPDSESAQWIEEAARAIGCPWCVLQKTRHGDRTVSIQGDLPPAARDCTPVLLDDVCSSGATLAEASRLLQHAGLPAPWVAVVHGLFAAGAETALRASGVTRIFTTDSIPHSSNAAGLAPLLAHDPLIDTGMSVAP
jgi:ribose-phosphate pyrophosphokinase